jgi:hypothetical protein
MVFGNRYLSAQHQACGECPGVPEDPGFLSLDAYYQAEATAIAAAADDEE